MTSGPFFDQFIDDYYAECDEHLAAVRRALLDLEARGHLPHDPQLRHALFRGLHTLKGLSGMVGLSTAEHVAHAMEECLRALGFAGESAAPRLVEALFEGFRLLERCIGSRQSGRDHPNVNAYLSDVKSMLRTMGAGGQADTPSAAPQTPPSPEWTEPQASPESIALPVPLVGEEPSHAMGMGAAGKRYRFTFTPSHELAARGVGVEAIRARLQAWGTVVSARPLMLPERAFAFEFVVIASDGATPDDAWRADALTWVADGSLESRSVELATIPSAIPATFSPLDAVTDDSRSSGPFSTSYGHTVLLASSDTVRVDLARLDSVMRMVGELVVSRARLDALTSANGGEADGESARGTVRETIAAMERQLRALREGVMRIRLVPIGEAFERLRFAIRDIARDSDKLVRLELSGQGTEIDKLVVDRMLEPLLHLVRNAVSHGLETPEERRASGKPPEGKLVLRAAAAGDRIVIEVEDDGSGIDVERVAERARSEGLLTTHEVLEGDALLDVLCEQGFSTRSEANLASGRGLGMAVVRAAIRALGGELSLETERGRGTRFVAEIPLTLMIVDALLVEIGPHQMAVPQPALREILRVDAETPTRFEANAVMPYRGIVLPLVSMRRMFGLPESDRDPFYVLVVGSDAHPLGLMVDRIIELREIVVHAVTDPLVAMPGISGATELGDGRICLIIDAAAVARIAQDRTIVRRERVRPAFALQGAHEQR